MEIAAIGFEHRIFKTPGHRVFLVRALLGLESYVQQFGTVTNWHRLFARVPRARERRPPRRCTRSSGRPRAGHALAAAYRWQDPLGQCPCGQRANGRCSGHAADHATSPCSRSRTCRSSTSPGRSRCSRCASRWLRERADAAPTPRIASSSSRADAGPLGTSSGLELVAERALPRGARRRRHAARRGRHRHGSGGRATRRCSHGSAAMAPRVRRLGSVCSGHLRARRGGAARRPARDHALARVRALARRLPGAHRRSRPDLRPRRQRLDLGRRHRGHGPGARARRGGPRPRAGARDVARELVLFLRRPGGQSQFSAQLAVQAADREPLRELQAWIAEHPGADLRSRRSPRARR